MRIYVTLTPAMIAEADKVAHLRMKRAIRDNLDVGRTATLEQQLADHILGARCERAGKHYYDPTKWNLGLSGAFIHLPDLGDFIEIKGVTEDRRGLCVPQKKIVAGWAFVLISAEQHPDYWIVGWMWGRDLAKEPLKFPQRPAY